MEELLVSLVGNLIMAAAVASVAYYIGFNRGFRRQKKVTKEAYINSGYNSAIADIRNRASHLRLPAKEQKELMDKLFK